MYIENSIVLRGHWDDIWRFSVEIEHWVERLPHYRRIDILEILEDGRKRRAYMSCWRDFWPPKWSAIKQAMPDGVLKLLRVPISWSTIQTTEPNDDPQEARIRYKHIGGVTKGMEVVWSFEPLSGDYYRVTISHDWQAKWLIVGRPATYVIQSWVVHNIADQTLNTIKRLAAHSQIVPESDQGILTRVAL
jgi:hypothetical protein